MKSIFKRIQEYFVNRSISKHKANMEQFREAWNKDNKPAEDTGISLHDKFVAEQQSFVHLNQMTMDGTLAKGLGMGSDDGLMSAGVTQNLSALGKEFTDEDFKMPDAVYLKNNHDAAVLPLDNLINACRFYFRDHQTTETDQRKRTAGQLRLDFVRFAKRKAENKKYCLYYERCVRGIKKFWPDIEGGGSRKGNPMGSSLDPTQMNQQSAMLNEMQQRGKVQGPIHKTEESIIQHADLEDAQRAAAAAGAFVFDEYGVGDWYNAAANLSSSLSELMNGLCSGGRFASELLTDEVKRNLKEKLQLFRKYAQDDWTAANVSVTNREHQSSISLDADGNKMVW